MIKMVFLLGAGVTIFLFGMLRLSTGIQKLFTARIRAYIRYAVKNPFWGLVTGVTATVLFQSSSATTVIAVGMVSAGLISFYNSLAVILGADIGTTVIVQLVVWKVGDLSPMFIMLGGFLWAAAKDRWKTIGEALFYFGLLFFGLSLIGMATEPLKERPEIIRFFKEAGHPLIGFIFSAVFTGLVHASAIPISILVILGQQDLISLNNALPMVLGANVGTAVTALMAGTVADVGGKRTALSHFVFKAVGAGLCMAILPVLLPLLRHLSDSIAQQIALSHFLLNIFIVGIFFFFLKPFSRMIKKIIPGREETLSLWPEFLSEALLANPEAAFCGVQKELEREAVLVQKIFKETTPLRSLYIDGKRKNIRYIEMVVNHLREEIIEYLRSISCRDLSPRCSKMLFSFTAVADDIERMANHMVNLVDLARTRDTRKIAFTESAMAELNDIEKLVSDNIEDAVQLIIDRIEERERISAISEREERIDHAVREARDRHLVRFHERLCPAEAGPVFLEMLIHLERISDHCQNIAEYLEELNQA
jgi:phosphate:Na+ symporter